MNKLFELNIIMLLMDKCSTNLNIYTAEPTVTYNKSFISFIVPYLIPSNFNFFTHNCKKDSRKDYSLTESRTISYKKGDEITTYFLKKQKPDQFGNWIRWKNIEDRFYYQNKITGNTQWDEPVDVKEGLKKSNWIQFKTLKGGQFFCNVLTKDQTWKKPHFMSNSKQLKLPSVLFFTKCETEFKIKPPLKDISQMKTIKTNWTDTIKRKTNPFTNSINSIIEYSNERERKNAFIDLLREKNVRFDEKWEKVLKRIINDVRYQVIGTLKLRKQFFFKYQKEILQEKKELQKQQKEKNRIDFVQMMKECLNIKPGFKFRHLVEILQKEQRFKAVKREDDRYKYFMDHVKQLTRVKRIEEKKAKNAFRVLLENCRSLRYDSSRRDVAKLHESGKIWNNQILNDGVRNRLFNLRIEQLRKKYTYLKHKKHLERLAIENNDDDNFCRLLYKLTYIKNPPLIHPKTSYEKFSKFKVVLKDFSFKVYDDKYRKAARYRQFEKFCWIMESQLRREKKILKDLLKKKKISISSDSCISLLMDQVKEYKSIKRINEGTVRILFYEMISKAIYLGKKE